MVQKVKLPDHYVDKSLTEGFIEWPAFYMKRFPSVNVHDVGGYLRENNILCRTILSTRDNRHFVVFVKDPKMMSLMLLKFGEYGCWPLDEQYRSILKMRFDDLVTMYI